jgi:predicted DNA-binding transcriptional regulator YafY
LSTLLDLEGSDELAAEARSLRSRIHAALPDAMKRRFEACEIVRRLAS